MNKQRLISKAGRLVDFVDLTTPDELLVNAALGIYVNIDKFIDANPPTKEQESYLRVFGFLDEHGVKCKNYNNTLMAFAAALCRNNGSFKIIKSDEYTITLNCLICKTVVSANKDGDGYLIGIGETGELDDTELYKICDAIFIALNKMLNCCYL